MPAVLLLDILVVSNQALSSWQELPQTQLNFTTFHPAPAPPLLHRPTNHLMSQQELKVSSLPDYPGRYLPDQDLRLHQPKPSTSTPLLPQGICQRRPARCSGWQVWVLQQLPFWSHRWAHRLSSVLTCTAGHHDYGCEKKIAVYLPHVLEITQVHRETPWQRLCKCLLCTSLTFKKWLK